MKSAWEAIRTTKDDEPMTGGAKVRRWEMMGGGKGPRVLLWCAAEVAERAGRLSEVPTTLEAILAGFYAYLGGHIRQEAVRAGLSGISAAAPSRSA
ncbi:uncharacterized protein PSFLO_01496 [Pseudozyma flocculosa]|uniref:Uncharacterized protein n=1 Tax=Pseudozyma flocculosa TaxID=84751 RepID=A0A5C3EW82_9BASI|nr:uncharacterized protein PSFLO_01496 [Pseudozyma flocculosa]